MASIQEKEERAEAAIRLAASELRDISSDQEFEAAGKIYKEEIPDDDAQQQQHRSPGVIGSVLKTVQDTLNMGKNQDTAYNVTVDDDKYKDYNMRKMERKIEEYKDSALYNAKEAKDSSMRRPAEKAEQAAEKARETFKEYKVYTAEKSGQTANSSTMRRMDKYQNIAVEKAKDAKNSVIGDIQTGDFDAYNYTAEKETEGKHDTVSKLGELKDSAADAARKARDLLLGKKDELNEKPNEISIHNKEAERGNAARETIYGAAPSMSEGIRSKLTQPTDVVEETRAARELGGSGRKSGKKEPDLADVEETTVEEAASVLQ